MIKNETFLESYFGTKVIAIEKRERGWKIKFNSSSQTLILFAKIVIDATELGDIAARVGAAYDVGMTIEKPLGYDPEFFYCASESDQCKIGEKMNRTLWPKDSLL